jgi:hypothetical protein
MWRWRSTTLLILLIVLSSLLWGALQSFHPASGIAAFKRLPDHDYLADIDVLRQQGKLTEALTLSEFVCDQPTYPQQMQACRMAEQLEARTRSVWYRVRSVGYGALTGAATNGWALAGAATADFFVVGDVRDLLLQSWRLSNGQKTDELLMVLSAVGVLTVAIPGADWVPSFGKVAARLGALSQSFSRQLLRLGRRAVATHSLTPLRGVFGNLRRLVQRLGPVKTLGILPAVNRADDLATLTRLATTHPRAAYGLLKVGGRHALTTVAQYAPAAIPDVVRAARKGVPGLRLYQRLGRRLFTSHLLVGAGKALHRGRLPQAMSLWLATQSATVRLLTTVLLSVAWLFTLVTLWRTWHRRRGCI